MKTRKQITNITLLVAALMFAAAPSARAQNQQVLYRTAQVDGLDIFYREAGSTDAPTILLLHGFPTSSHMFRNLMPALADKFHLIAPDYPGFGNSSMPKLDEFDYTFDRLAEVMEDFIDGLGIEKYTLYVMDYGAGYPSIRFQRSIAVGHFWLKKIGAERVDRGAPVGFRIAAKHPERVESLIVQNGNAYDEGLRDFWKPIKAYWKDKTTENAEALRNSLLTLEATRWQYTNGVRDPETVSPDNWLIDQYLLERPGNKEIQLQLFYDYGSNPPLYPKWQAYFREFQPPTLIVWGKNDYIFPAEGAIPYERDLKNVESHLLDTGHFALEEDGEVIAGLIRNFLQRKLTTEKTLIGKVN